MKVIHLLEEGVGHLKRRQVERGGKELVGGLDLDAERLTDFFGEAVMISALQRTWYKPAWAPRSSRSRVATGKRTHASSSAVHPKSVLQTELGRLAGQLAERLAPLSVAKVAIAQEILDVDAPVRARLVMGDFTFVEQLHQMRP